MAKLPPPAAEAIPGGETREKIAALVGVGRTSIGYAKKVIEDGIPELVQAVGQFRSRFKARASGMRANAA